MSIGRVASHSPPGLSCCGCGKGRGNVDKAKGQALGVHADCSNTKEQRGRVCTTRVGKSKRKRRRRCRGRRLCWHAVFLSSLDSQIACEQRARETYPYKWVFSFSLPIPRPLPIEDGDDARVEVGQMYYFRRCACVSLRSRTDAQKRQARRHIIVTNM